MKGEIYAKKDKGLGLSQNNYLSWCRRKELPLAVNGIKSTVLNMNISYPAS